jgi:hypothetical protein
VQKDTYLFSWLRVDEDWIRRIKYYSHQKAALPFSLLPALIACGFEAEFPAATNNTNPIQ